MLPNHYTYDQEDTRMPFAQGAYGIGPPPPRKSRGTYIPGKRYSMNMLAIAVCVLLPWIVFTTVYATLSFSVHYEHPNVAYSIVYLGLFAVLACGYLLVESRRRKHYYVDAERAPSWLCFMFLTILVAWLAAVHLGERNYTSNTKPYYDMLNLGNYTDIYPSRMRGQQMMDAGTVRFAVGSHVEVGKSMGFKSFDMYCVAPISLGNETLSTYDFWVVGKDCCSGYQADFHCEGYNDPRARGGLRLVRETDRAYYRLAVQQAEAAHKIRAIHPLFFHWVQDPDAVVLSWLGDGWRSFYAGTFTCFVMQAFLVAFAAVAYSKMGKW